VKKGGKNNLEQENESLRKENARLSAENERLRQEVKLLNEKIDWLMKKMFGSSSEALNANQLDLFAVLPEAQAPEPDGSLLAAAMIPEKPKTKSKRRERIPENLPAEKVVIDPPEVLANPEKWRRIGEEISERLDFEPGRFFRRLLVRPKYVLIGDKEAAPVIAPLPECLQERGIAAPGLLATVAVSKYCDHLPLYRQEMIFKTRHGVALPRSTLSRWMELVAFWLQPIYEIIRTTVMDNKYVQIDETPVSYLEPGNGKTKKGYLWTAHAPGLDAVFHWETGRSAACLENIVPMNFRGVLQCDAYAAYPAFANKREGIELVGCWAHARRHFHEALEHVPLRANWVLYQIQNLYRIEARLRKSKAGPALRAVVRASQSTMVLNRLKRALENMESSRRHLPASSFGQAISYTLSNWESLIKYVGNGRVEIDNNGVENAIRPTAIGKKNWLFFEDADAGQRSAIIYTIIESCRRRGIDPHEYLRDVLTRITESTNWNVADLTPQKWAKNKIPLKKAA
jgi:transposase